MRIGDLKLFGYEYRGNRAVKLLRKSLRGGKSMKKKVIALLLAVTMVIGMTAYVGIYQGVC